VAEADESDMNRCAKCGDEITPSEEITSSGIISMHRQCYEQEMGELKPGATLQKVAWEVARAWDNTPTGARQNLDSRIASLRTIVLLLADLLPSGDLMDAAQHVVDAYDHADGDAPLIEAMRALRGVLQQ
jgi:hypothetical protein